MVYDPIRIKPIYNVAFVDESHEYRLDNYEEYPRLRNAVNGKTNVVVRAYCVNNCTSSIEINVDDAIVTFIDEKHCCE